MEELIREYTLQQLFILQPIDPSMQNQSKPTTEKITYLCIHLFMTFSLNLIKLKIPENP